ncbi:Six-hairpin glycosidase-like protein [Penicillium vulpinum]|uniref:Glucuronyl hydrolase n=1 Tax=Penicillium vulpinum TaxID=29845 RepID=A0A1V6SAX6_9EURO|nr:Six-hairpin glycosidase-like protein [Penicillium vulpinum]KAJ5960408.1 Six-hairpin glycosidase-like protein [Penicillium vulpinum]OQE10920.1 hypothetical protein PENVUL_c003G07803 [Penicillium vulpinum]
MALQSISSPPSNGDLEVEVKSARMTATEIINSHRIRESLSPLFSENTLAKIIGAAELFLDQNDPPIQFPETVPQAGPTRGEYQCRDAEFWTCGFFPGSLYCLLERLRKYPGTTISNISNTSSDPKAFQRSLISHLTNLCRTWSAPLYPMSARTDTHDLGFIVQPALRRDWELFGNQESLNVLLHAADSLASRYDEKIGAIRSWDSFTNAHHNFVSLEDDFLVIIDNLDLLFYAGNYTRNPHLISIATTHATTLLTSHLRKEPISSNASLYSTYHGVNFSPQKGTVKRKFTAQGYADESTWARGQAWAILGYAQTYSWTKKQEFLDAAKGLADYFIYRLETAPKIVEEGGCGRHVPLWDFDAPITYTTVNGTQAPLRDVSAGMAAANGMVILYGQLLWIGEHETARRYLEYAMAIVKDTIALAYNRDSLSLKLDEKSLKVGVEKVEGADRRRFDAILERSTANFNGDHADRAWDHGLVYADYYFLEFGNRLLDIGLI